MSGRQSQLTALRAVNSDLYRQLNELRAAKDAEIDSLTFQLSEANRVLEAHKIVAASRSENIAALKADKERMREGILDIKGNPSKYFEEDYPLPEHPDRMQLKTNHVAFNALLSPADTPKDYIAHDNAFRACVEVVLHSNGSINRMEHRIYALAREWAGRPLSELDRKMIDSLSPADDTYDSGKWGVPNNLDRPADGDGVEETVADDIVWDRGTCYVNDYHVGHLYGKNGYFSYGRALGFSPPEGTSQDDILAIAGKLALKWYTAHKDEIV